MKFLFFVEGDLEKKILGPFVRRWLDSRLTHRVAVQAIQFRGVNAFKKKITATANLHLRSSRSDSIIAACGLLDLYGVDFYPHDLSESSRKYDWLVRHFSEEVGHKKFRMFAAVHEIEAWLLSQPDLFPPAVRDALPASAGQPERVDFQEPPAKLLHRLFKDKLDRGYKKTTDGVNLFTDLDADLAYQKCPYLRGMLDELLALAKSAGC